MNHSISRARVAVSLFCGLLALTSARAEEGAQLSPEASRSDSTLTSPSARVEAAGDSARPDWPELDSASLGAPDRRVRLNASDRNVLRSGPGEDFSLVAVVAKGADFAVIAKSGDWYNVRLSGTETAWVHQQLCREYDDLSDLELRPNPRLYSRTGCFLLTGYTGGYAFDKKSNGLAIGSRVGYYVFDFLEVEGGLSWTHVRRPREVVESLFDLELEAERFSMLFYQMNLRLELLPGRRMVPFITGGVGTSLLLGKSESGSNLGAGTLLFFNKRNAMRWECRDYRFHSGVGASRRLNNNLEFSLGTAFLL